MSIQIIQLSDFHLTANTNKHYECLQTIVSLKKLLKLIQNCFSNTECFILTGDLANDERKETYVKLRGLLEIIAPAYYLIPGNHDDRSAMQQIFPDSFPNSGGRDAFSIMVGGWRLIGLNSKVDGELFGRVAGEQLRWLDKQLASHPDQPTIIFIHHPPCSVGSPWLDEIGLKEPRQLAQVLKKSKQVQALCTGHIHQEFEGIFAGIKVFGVPSTSIQFRPSTVKLEIDSLTPGFRLLNLHCNSFDTKVIRLTNK